MQVLERILAVDFRFPGSIPVSAECKNLLSRILVADPAKRASIEEIQQHPWCALQPRALRQREGPVTVPHVVRLGVLRTSPAGPQLQHVGFDLCT